MTNFSLKYRTQWLADVKKEVFDLVIIGGGITGAGLAVQAAASGIKTVLIEQNDFAAGTSSRSTKLVHGGIRYLKTFDVELVAETVQERAIIQQIAPHIPRPEMMLLPIYDRPDNTFTLKELKIAMDLYDQLAQLEDEKYRNRLLSRAEVLELQPLLKSEGLLGGGYYLDYRNNDARLVIENLKQAYEDGAIILSRMEACGLELSANGQIKQVIARDCIKQEKYAIKTKVVVNAAGPWSDQVRSLDPTFDERPQLRPSKGVHIVVDGSRLPVNGPIYFDSPWSDGRMIFVLPRFRKTYIGTTDTDYRGDLKEPRVEAVEVEYLLASVNEYFPQAALSLNDIEASWAGIRPLVGESGGLDYNGVATTRVSAEDFAEIHQVFAAYAQEAASREEVEAKLLAWSQRQNSHSKPSAISRGSDLSESPSGLITIAGGKLTDYRKMAEATLQQVIKKLIAIEGVSYHAIDSSRYQISGGHFDYREVAERLYAFKRNYEAIGLDQLAALELANLYGSNAEGVIAYREEAQQISQTFGLDFKEALSLLYALNEEAVLTAADYLFRRTNHALFNSNRMSEIQEAVLQITADYFQLSGAEQAAQSEELNKLLALSRLEDLKLHQDNH